jgi:AcrR family transcriptional regulator
MRAPKTKTEIRRNQIAATALALVARHGLRALNVAALAKGVGVVPSAIYRHYPSKEAVLDAVLKVIAHRLFANVQAVRQEFTDRLEGLKQLLQRHIEMVLSNQGIPRVIFSEEIFSGQPARRRRVYQIIQEYLEKVAEMIREGQRQGRISPDLPAETVAMMFLGVVQSASILRLMSDGQFDATKYRESAWRIFSGMLSNCHRKPSTESNNQTKRNRKAKEIQTATERKI